MKGLGDLRPKMVLRPATGLRGGLVLVGVVVIGLGGAGAFEPNSVEQEIAAMAEGHSSQGRAEMVPDPLLHVVARAKAEDLGRRGYFAHVDPDGFGPNRAAQLAGYELPSWWGSDRDANYIESIAAGYGSAQAAFDGWMDSPGHRRHLLAEESFYAEQTRYGVGYASVPGSPYTRYYVFISAPPSPAANEPDPYVEWLFQNYLPKDLEAGSDADDEDGDGLSRIEEFAFGGDLESRDVRPAPDFDPASGRLEWEVATPDELGSVRVDVECSRDLVEWTSEGVVRDGDMFSIGTGDGCGFMRVVVGRE